MADGAITKRPAQKRLPLLTRLRQRWLGSAKPKAAARPAPKAAAAPAAAGARQPAPSPLVVRQCLYGPGFIIPGDVNYVLELVKPFQLGPSMTMLDLAAGL